MELDRRTVLRAIGASSIGAVAASYTSDRAAAATVVTLRGAGADIWGRADEGFYYYDHHSGDFDVSVRNTSLDDTSAYAKAGVLVRDSLAPDAKAVMVRRNPSGDVSLQWRPEAGAETLSTTSGGEDRSDVSGGTYSAEWLRLRRRNGAFSAYASTDGETWTRVARLTADDVELGADVTLGLGVTSHNEGTLCTAEFRGLTDVSPSAGTDIGDVDLAGSVSVADSVPIVRTGDASDVTHRSMRLRGTLTDLGGAESAECYFQYRRVPTEQWRTTASTTLDAPGSFDRRVDGLEKRTYYQVRAVVDAGDGDTNYGATDAVGTPSPANSGSSERHRDAGPSTRSRFAPGDGFASVAPWLDDDTPVIRITEPTLAQLSRALSVDGPRIVAFETSGTIDLQREHLTVTSDELYVAGQTAPSPGITLVRGDVTINADDCVVQHIRVRGGDANADVGWEPDGLRTEDGTSNNVIDHCSVSWSVDENLSAGYDTTDTTISNCLIAEGLANATHHKGEHSTGSLIGNGAKNVALLGNVWSDNVDRNPRMKKGTHDVLVNNVVAHFDDAAVMGDSTVATIVGNAFVDAADTADAAVENGHAYLEDNRADDAVALTDGVETLEERPLWPDDVDPLPASEALEHNLANAGARPGDRTPQDRRILADVADGDGAFIDSQSEVGGYPDLPVNRRRLRVPSSGTRAWLSRQARTVETPGRRR
ncbi:pectate lyase (plasmid) [Halarchaeum sp. CBA1220]|uniref:pectate lyase n=1 Tax=Halarchaeum sp. CBA1220 TaxID=1853682 RepID=UPI000F3A8B21|nr:pectate lyase [Halarchaeum sp. CBA1220]QLC34738.1 pectate lyase [Halarchaeum sp. CBA1220]